MKILCTKEEFAEMIDDCAFNSVSGEHCDGCFFNCEAEDLTECSLHLVKLCEIVTESEGK